MPLNKNKKPPPETEGGKLKNHPGLILSVTL
jgi:hypothetical protein